MEAIPVDPNVSGDSVQISVVGDFLQLAEVEVMGTSVKPNLPLT
jgi:hypothetical protein